MYENANKGGGVTALIRDELDELNGEHILELKEPKVFDNIFCIGDVCLSSAHEEKTIFPLRQCSKICAHNIKAMSS